ncbi:hypothetical protein N7461_002879 [Penicillium sp. DV-2018c]|nr:hypothetical protein N7461_002879 [Penicillium sp. DV-2018c]
MGISRLLVTKRDDAAFTSVYEAHFTSELLEAIEDSRDARAYINWPINTMRKIPFKAYGAFQERLVDELLRPAHRGAVQADVVNPRD